jgi:hypothetical protein
MLKLITKNLNSVTRAACFLSLSHAISGATTTTIYCLSDWNGMIVIGMMVTVSGIITHLPLLIYLSFQTIASDSDRTMHLLGLYVLLLNIPLFILCFQLAEV